MSKLTKVQARLVKNDADASRLYAKVDESHGDCWHWGGATNADGYGYLAFRGKTWKAHRVSYTLFNGEIPEGIIVCHHCDNPACVNPSHLFLGHHSTNMKDMVRKGRGRTLITSKQCHFKPGKPPSGAQASAAKLSEDDARAIIASAIEGTTTGDLSKRFSVHRTTIQRILRGASFSHLERPECLPRATGAYERRDALAEQSP